MLEGDNMVSRLHVGDSLSHGLDDTGTLVSENDGKCALRILP